MPNSRPRRRFYGREWIFNKLCYYMNAQWPTRTGLTSAASGCIIYGGAGCGKTAICREIAQPSVSGVNNKQNELHQSLLADHFRKEDILYENAPKMAGAGFVFDLIGKCLKSKLLGNYSEIVQSDLHLHNLANSELLCSKRPLEALIKLLVEPFNKLSPQPSRTLCFIIDSVDNDVILDDNGLQNRHKCAEILQILGKIYKLLPPWLYLIFTSRKICKTLKKLFADFSQICLDDLYRSTVIWDIQQYILKRLDDEENLRVQLNLETAESLNHLHIKSNGCILYLKIVLDSAVNFHQMVQNRDSALRFISLKDIQQIPSTLNGLYMWLCQRLIEKSSLKIVKALFQILLASTQPMTLNDLYQCVRLSDTSLTKNHFCYLITLLNSLLVIDQSDQSCTILHYSFAEWLLDVKYCTPKFLCHLHFGHSYISLWYANRSQDLNESEIIDFAYHLTCSSKSNHSSWFDENRENLAPLACFLLECRTPVQNLILKNKAINDRTTRLLLDAGADFVSLDNLEVRF
uniref:Orc1-like AAA ATPase domain-containing protein n=1 Tax=Romanomermis culicivorax TaxID=13658 RepID=A0A915JKP9_ROMCU